MKLLTTIMAFILSSTVMMAVADIKKVITVGVLATESSVELRKIWQPFVEDMEKALGVEVKAYYTNDYSGLIQAMRFGKVDVVRFGNKSGIEAVDRAGGEVFAKAINKDGSDGYYSLLITHVDNQKLNSLEDVIKHRKNLTFGNGDPNSTSGFLVPAYYIFALNNLKTSAFKRVLNSSHGNNQLAVINKKVDVATNNTENLARLKRRNPDMYNKIKIIWQSPVIPSDPVIWRKDLDADTKKAIYDFYMDYSDDKYESSKLHDAKFIPGHDLQLLAVRELNVFKKLRVAEKEGKKAEIKKLQETLADYKRQTNYINVLLGAE